MMGAAEESEEEGAPQIHPLINGKTAVPCSTCWLRRDPGYTKFWLHFHGDRNGENPKSILMQLADEFGGKKTSKRERGVRVLQALTAFVDEKFAKPATHYNDPISPPNSNFTTMAQKYFTTDHERALYAVDP